MYYRSRYNSVRKHRGNRTLIIIIAAFIIITTLTVIFGNYLKNKTADAKANASPIPDEVTVAEEDISITEKAPDLSAIPIDLAALEDATIKDAVENISLSSYSGASILLTDENGHPLYQSNVTSMFLSSNESSNEADESAQSKEKISLLAVTEALHRNGLRAIGCFDVRYLKAQSAAEEALRSYEIALISELSSLGIDEVILLGLSVPGENDACHFEYVEKIKNAAPELKISAAFDIDAFDSASLEFNMLLSRLDFITVEISAKADEETALSDVIEEKISENLIIFTKYSPRVVMKRADGQDMIEQIQAAADNMLQSWLIY